MKLYFHLSNSCFSFFFPKISIYHSIPILKRTLFRFLGVVNTVYPKSFYTPSRSPKIFCCVLLALAIVGCKTKENRAPEIQSVPIEIAQAGVKYSYQVIATDKDNDPLTYSLDEKPNGMVIDAVTGMISWIPDTGGIFNIKVLVDDNEGHVVPQIYSITVTNIITIDGEPCSPQEVCSPPPPTQFAKNAFAHLQDVMDRFHTTFDVYTDRGAAGNHFIPSGWMGNHTGLSLDENWNEDCHAGDSCIRITYAPGGANWAGIYWQTPENNWGTVKKAGFDLTGATKLTFWAKGETGGEKIAFLLGGITGTYPDSVSKTYTEGCVQSGADCFVTLSNDWKKYTIDLKDKNLTHVVGGFAFVTNTPNNPTGAVFFLDDIQYDKDRLDQPRLLVSYEAFPTTDPTKPDVYLRTPAFVYDNALAALAFLSRGGPDDIQRAKLILDAFIYAQNNDRVYTDGRLRNAYMAGDLIDHMTGKARLPVWWDANEGKGREDIFQISTHTGNLAWAAMAMLGYYEQVGGEQYLQAAITLAEWVENNTRDGRGTGGYTVGFDGWSESQKKILQKSTEQNIDVYLLFSWLERLTGKIVWEQRAEYAKTFVESMWSEAEGHFWTGTDADGITIVTRPIPADTQSLAVLALNQQKYEVALDWAENNLTTEKDDFTGFDFNEDKDGIWFEGTAQMVVSFRKTGKIEQAIRYSNQLKKAQDTATNSNEKGIVAASHDGVSTGFKDWVLVNRLHVGATAWFIFSESEYAPWDLPVKVVVDSYPKTPSNSDTAAFEFSSTKTSVQYRCKIDDRSYADCVSPTEYSGLTEGDHTFCMTGRDTDSGLSSSPVCSSWRIDVTMPTNNTSPEFINNGLLSTDSTKVVLTLSASDANGIAAYYVMDGSLANTPVSPGKDDDGWQKISSSNEYSANVAYQISGEYENHNNIYIYVWFRDEAGNISASVVDSILFRDDSNPVNTTVDGFASGNTPSTSSGSIKLTISATDNAELSGYFVVDNDTGIQPNSPSADTSGWHDIPLASGYEREVIHRLGSDYAPGTQVFIYIWFKDWTGNVSEVASDSFVAQTFSEGFVDGWGPWSADNGVWQVGSPEAGPESCFSGDSCAGTELAGKYGPHTDSRLVSPVIVLSTLIGLDEIHLRFQQWFSYSERDVGYVQVQVWDGAAWGEWVDTGVAVSDTSGWSLGDVDLTAYAGETVRLGFLHTADRRACCSSESTGWYIDDIQIVIHTPNFKGDFEAAWGGWGAQKGVWQVGTPTAGPGSCFSGSDCVGTEVDGNYGAYTDSRLVSPTVALPVVTGPEGVHLRFQQWFSYSERDAGHVQIQVWDGAVWGEWIDTGVAVSDTSGWSLGDVDLTAYAGEIVRLGFLHTADRRACCSSESTGWYIDDIRIETF